MLNLIRMNLYRMLHTKSIFIVLLIGTAFGALAAYMSSVEMEEAPNGVGLTLEYQDGSTAADDLKSGFEAGASDADVNFGIYTDVPELEDGKPAPFMKYFCSDMAGGILLIFITIATVLYINGEEKSGFVKNIAGQTKHKCNIFISKLIVMIGYLLVSMVLYAAAEYAALMIFYNGDMEFCGDILGEALKYIGIEFILYIAFISGLAMLTTIFKNTTIGITVGILASCGFANILTGLINKLIDVDISKYLVVNNINSVSFGAENKTLILAIIVGIVFNIVYNVAGTMWFTKRDVV